MQSENTEVEVGSEVVGRPDARSGDTEGDTCPMCNSRLVHIGKCMQCLTCGWNACGL